MARNTTLTMLRNNAIRAKFRKVRVKNPKWTIIAVIDEVAQAFYLEPTTITKILKEMDEKVPAVDTIAKYAKHEQLMLF